MSDAEHDKNRPDRAGAEADSPRTAYIFLAVVVSVVVLVGMIIGIDQFFGFAVQDEIARKVLQVPNSQLRQLRSEEAARLSRYQWVDQEAGVLRIPVERAMELVLAEWKTSAAAQPPADGPATTGGEGAQSPAGAQSPEGEAAPR